MSLNDMQSNHGLWWRLHESCMLYLDMVCGAVVAHCQHATVQQKLSLKLLRFDVTHKLDLIFLTNMRS